MIPIGRSRTHLAIVFATMALLLLAFAPRAARASMPGLGGDDEKKIDVPITPQLFQATVTDVTLTDTSLDEFSIDGYTHIQGKLGAGVLSIRFDEIAKIDFEPAEKNQVVALVTLKSGGVKKLMMDGKTPLYGKTSYGSYRVLAKDVKHVAITAGPIKRGPGGTADPAPNGAKATKASP